MSGQNGDVTSDASCKESATLFARYEPLQQLLRVRRWSVAKCLSLSNIPSFSSGSINFPDHHTKWHLLQDLTFVFIVNLFSSCNICHWALRWFIFPFNLVELPDVEFILLTLVFKFRYFIIELGEALIPHLKLEVNSL